MDLPIAEAYRGQGYGSYLAKSVVNQLMVRKMTRLFKLQ